MFTDKLNKFFVDNKNLPTPYVVIDTSIIADKYDKFKECMQEVEIFYAVKSNPSVEILKLLNSKGSFFDVASLNEIKICLACNIPVAKLSWSNPFKKANEIKQAYELGVKVFVCDSMEELVKLGEHAPNAQIICRIFVSNQDSVIPLENKFGCSTNLAIDILLRCKALNLVPYGISFHVGSQQLNPVAWSKPIKEVANITRILALNNIVLEVLNIGGGFPAYGYLSETQILNFQDYSNTILQYIKEHKIICKIIAEPGRFLVADSGILKSEVVLVAKKDYDSLIKWLYLDVGVFSGLMETINEGIKYNITLEKYQSNDLCEFFLAGPTCDSVDVMYKDFLYKFPCDIKSGDYAYIHSTGAYTTSYSAICFNGFPPLDEYII